MTTAEFLHKIDKELYGHKHILRMVILPEFVTIIASRRTNFLQKLKAR